MKKTFFRNYCKKYFSRDSNFDMLLTQFVTWNAYGRPAIKRLENWNFNQCERPFTSRKKTASKNTCLRTHLDDLGHKKINVVMNIWYFIFEEESLLICQI